MTPPRLRPTKLPGCAASVMTSLDGNPLARQGKAGIALSLSAMSSFTGSLIATWMTARALLDNWVWWIVVDAASLVLYASQGLVFVALLYLIYMIIAVIGLRDWSRRLRAAPPQAAA